jgi:hypothetical protein
MKEKIKKIFLLSVPGLSIFSSLTCWLWSMDCLAEQATANPNSVRYFVLHGDIDPNIDVNFLVAYKTTNPSCEHDIAALEGAKAPAAAQLPLKAVYSGQRYTAHVAVDGVLPGNCGWTFDGVTATGSDHSGHPLAFRNGSRLVLTNSLPLQAGQNPDVVLNLVCQVQLIHNGLSDKPWLSCQSKNSPYPNSVAWWHASTKDIEINFHYH